MDYGVILDNCGVGRDSAQSVVRNIANLEEFYDETELVKIYNYMLLHIKTPEIVLSVIRFSDAHRAATTLGILVDTLLMRNGGFDDEEGLINIRAMCAKAISNYKDTSTVEALLFCLNNKGENYKVRLACADALGRIGDRYAVVPLIDVVKDEDEKSVYLKESATSALGMLGDIRAIDPLVEIMESNHALWGKFQFLKEKIIEALGKLNINNKKVLKVLKESLYDISPMVRINAIEALMNSDYEEAPELIREVLNDDDDEVKKNALIALYNLIGRDILDEVISLPNYGNFLKQEAKKLIEEYENQDEES